MPKSRSRRGTNPPSTSARGRTARRGRVDRTQAEPHDDHVVTQRLRTLRAGTRGNEGGEWPVAALPTAPQIQHQPPQAQPELSAPVVSDVAQSSGDSAGNGLNSMLRAHANIFHEPQPAMMNYCNSSISHHVDSQMKQKIVNGEFVNFATLLVRDHSAVQTASTLSVDNRGQLVAQPKQPNKLTTIERWTDTFVIFASVYLAAHPERTLQLWKYLHDIRLGASKAVGWINYDEQFRLRMAMNPSMDWGKVDGELWLMCMTPSLASPSKPQNL